MNKAVWLAKRNYWIAGIGALISLFAFFVLNFLTVGYSFSLPDLGLGGTTTTTPLTSYSIGVTGTSLASYEGLLWVSVLLVAGVLGMAIWLLARRSPFGWNVAMNVQARWTALGFVAAAVLSAVCVVASLALIAQSYQNILNESMGSLGSLNSLGSAFSNLFHFNFTWDIGAYLFLVGLVIIVIAGMMEMIAPARVLSDAEMAVMWNYPQNQYPQNQYPQNQYPQNQYNYPTAAYGPPSMQGPQPSADPNPQYGPVDPSLYGGSLPPQGSSYPPVSGQQPPASPYGPPPQFPPYGE